MEGLGTTEADLMLAEQIRSTTEGLSALMDLVKEVVAQLNRLESRVDKLERRQ
jgi:hypothetical protein